VANAERRIPITNSWDENAGEALGFHPSQDLRIGAVSLAIRRLSWMRATMASLDVAMSDQGIMK
jgi:hypothetical protein